MTEKAKSILAEIEGYTFTFPILENLSGHLKSTGLLKNRKIGWHCHLTGITAAASKALVEAGANLYMSECSAETTDKAAVDHMKELGIQVFEGKEGPLRVLENNIEIISDTGFELSSKYLSEPGNNNNRLIGACEITSSGISRLRALPKLEFPIININDGELKSLIENYHGVGDGVTEALFRATQRVWSGRSAAVLGYGRVGAGVAYHLRQKGAVVSVVELDPTRKLVAHYDGFSLANLKDALSNCELIVTASGSKNVISEDSFNHLKDGIILMNVGHWPEEIDLQSLKANALSCRKIHEHLDEYELKSADGSAKKVYILGGAGPANVVMLSGSPEPTLIHLSTEILCMEYLFSAEAELRLKPGENAIPNAVQKQASLLALKSLGL